MRNGSVISTVIPALNEEEAIGKVISALPDWLDEVIVVDNGSTDRTVQVARSHGVRVISEARRGYGSACLAGIAALGRPDVVIFLDGDFSDHPGEAAMMVDPIINGEADLVIGSRTLGRSDPGALTPQARFGNWLACRLIKLFWKVRYTDLGPFRAIRRSALEQLGMRDRDYGWTVEMQVKAAKRGLAVREVAASYRRRIGKSKISGTIRGVTAAGTKILYIIFREALASCCEHVRRAPHRKLIVFTRHPRPGEVKTRMIPLLGDEGAAALHRVMTEHTMNWARELAARSATSLEVCFAAGEDDSASAEGSVRQWLGRDLACRPQAPGDLGERMTRAFRRAFAEGAGRAVVVGTDCPGITASLAGEAFDALGDHDLVLGPALDGGYYLIGLRKFAGPLFAEMPWGTRDVLARTLEAAREGGLSWKLLEPLPDVDRPEDIGVWRREAPSGPTSPPEDAGILGAGPQRISVIIPALDEAANIGGAIASVNGQAEIIVADGGSSDDTAAIALAHGAKVIHGPPGRARQMNAGAAAASGDALLFLHADTRLPARFHEHVCRTLEDSRTAAGAFHLRLNSRALGMKLVESMANLRSRCLGMPYGDQAIFLRAETFRDAGGFPDIPAMEDFELMRRLRRRGRITIAPADVVSSARRWLKQGVIVTTLRNKAALFGYRLGVPARHIARWRGRG